jgi:acetyltransferase-like isoleucine patch superfamily enzyme
MLERFIQRIRGNTIIRSGAVLRSTTFNIKGTRNTIKIEPGSYLNDVAFNIWGDGHAVHIGANCRFVEGGEIYIWAERCSIDIGENCRFGNVHLAITEPARRISIGADCMFGRDIDVRTDDSHAIVDAETGTRINPGADVLIADRVWVGSHCSILKGAVVSTDSVVGTRSVVTGRFPDPNVIIAGAPAREIRRGICWLK